VIREIPILPNDLTIPSIACPPLDCFKFYIINLYPSLAFGGRSLALGGRQKPNIFVVLYGAVVNAELSIFEQVPSVENKEFL
jgi:hypothetical protein